MRQPCFGYRKNKADALPIKIYQLIGYILANNIYQQLDPLLKFEK